MLNKMISLHCTAWANFSFCQNFRLPIYPNLNPESPPMPYTFTLAPEALETELKKLILQEADKTDVIDLPDFSDDLMLFGDASPIGLDSLDALQISVALQQHFRVRLQGDRMVRKHMMCVRDLAAFVRAEHGA